MTHLCFHIYVQATLDRICGLKLGVNGGRVPPLMAKNLPKIAKRRGKNQDKWGKTRKNREEKAEIGEGSFALPLLTDRAGYATGSKKQNKTKIRMGSYMNLPYNLQKNWWLVVRCVLWHGWGHWSLNSASGGGGDEFGGASAPIARLHTQGVSEGGCPQKLETYIFVQLESCNLVNTFRCKFRAGNKQKRHSSVGLTDQNFIIWGKLLVNFARIIKNQPF